MSQQRCIVLLIAAMVIGCGDGGEPKFPEVNLDPAMVASNIMSEYDTNSNGEISMAELKKNKGLLALTNGNSMLLPELRLDSDGSGSISEEEFAKKFTDCFKDRRQGYSCNVTFRGEPLENATVTLVPASFMGDIPTASGETDFDGNCSVTTPDGLNGAVPGIYVVEITHPDLNLPAKYNEKSTITVALDPTNPYGTEGVPTFKLR